MSIKEALEAARDELIRLYGNACDEDRNCIDVVLSQIQEALETIYE